MSEDSSENELKLFGEPAEPGAKKARKSTRKRTTRPPEGSADDGAKKPPAKKAVRKTTRKKVTTADSPAGEAPPPAAPQSDPAPSPTPDPAAAKNAPMPEAAPPQPARRESEDRPEPAPSPAGKTAPHSSEARSPSGPGDHPTAHREEQRPGASRSNDSGRSGDQNRSGGGTSRFRQPGGGGDGGNRFSGNSRGSPNIPNRKKKKRKGKYEPGGGSAGGPRRNTPFSAGGVPVEVDPKFELGQLLEDEFLQDLDALQESFDKLYNPSVPPVRFNDLYELPLQELRDRARRLKLDLENAPSRTLILQQMLKHFEEKSNPVLVEGCLEVLDNGFGIVVFPEDSYRLKPLCPFVSEGLVEHHGLQRGHTVEVLIQAPREGETSPIVLKVRSVMGGPIEALEKITPFTELVPYYPLDRILLESAEENPENNTSMRVVDLISPIGFGQRGLIVAPPRTGKTVLLQGIAHSVQVNYPEAHLIVLLIDERPEEVTDFRRRVKGEVISSTFDETAGSHVHAAEMVIEKARRMVEAGRDVVILLDSITRLARAYNTLMPNSGKILSGGVEANALQKPKRFFGSARNIEEGGSITIMGTALVDTGSKMDEVIFEEFKGTGNMELHLDRSLVDKRIFPALAMDRSGTRKEELLYHPDEMQKVYSLRRATKGVPPVEAMEMLIQRVKKTRSNAEFLMTLSR